MILCMNSGCQTTAGCICDRVGRSPKPADLAPAIDWKHLCQLASEHRTELEATITSLQAEVARLREALQWIADGYEADAHASRTCARRARAALGGDDA